MSVEYGQPQEWGQQQAYYPPPRPERPLGVTILAVLSILGGALLILVGILAAALGAVFASALASSMHGIPLILAAEIGIVLIIGGAIELLIGWGLWKGAGWAWWLTVIFDALGVIMSIASLASGNVGSVIGLIINAVILYYFFKPHVKAFFGVTAGPTT